MMEVSTESPIKKTKRLTSVVWNHFERIRKADVCYAVCVHCGKKLSGSSNSGTTHLRNHLVRCLKRSNFDVSQILSAKRKRKDSNTLNLTNVNHDEEQRKDESILPVNFKFDQEQKKEETINVGCIKFDQERSRLDLARMIMLHGYPIAMVEHVGFKIFVKNLQPLFEVMHTSTIELDCLTIYGNEKQKVYEMMRNFYGRISLAVDIWTSLENARYLCLTANYVDEDWKVQKKILNFVTLDFSHTDDMLSEVVIKCLRDWDIDHKLFSITFDDCSVNDDVIIQIKELVSQKRPLLKNGELFDVRCATHIVKSVVLDAMEAFQDVIHRIRESVKYVKSSQATLGKFNEIVQQVGANSQKHLILDSPMRWDSGYLMLETAAEYKAAFLLLQQHDPLFIMALSEGEWDRVSSIAGYMKLCVEITNVFSGNKCPTANIYFPEICDLHIQLIEWCKKEDDVISSMALKMKAKFDKYWSKCSLALAIAAILDPRFKMKLVEYYYSQIYGSGAQDHIKDVCDSMKELFNEYSVCSNSLDQGPGWPGSSLSSASNGTRDRLKGFDKFLHETSQSQSIISDLDKYLEEPIFPRNYDFNLLNWWKVHTPRYPILSMMARDILGIPVSTVAPELAFSTGSKVLDHHQSSLNPDTRQALICGQDWLRMEIEEANPSSGHTAVPLLMEAS